MVREIRAKSLLSGGSPVHEDSWFKTTYTMNIYRGCEHQCIYCDSRSECYQIENFADVLVKINAADLLEQELSRKRRKGTIGTGAMSDPYTPVEKRYNLTRRALEVVASHAFPLHLMTKSDMVLRDVDVLQKVSKVYACVNFTLTTVDDDLAAKVEPGAPRPSARLRAMKLLSDSGIYAGVSVMPVLPFFEDSDEQIKVIFEKAKEHGAQFALFSPGMTLRDRQRAYYYQKLRKRFPGMAERYNRRYGNQYSCLSPRAAALTRLADELSGKLDLPLKLNGYRSEQQMML
jgi:DNA repair photolyase